MVWYRLLADGVVVVHLFYVTFVILGLVAILVGPILGWKWIRNVRFRVIHLLMIGLVVAESLIGVTCPLTDLENWLRKTAGNVDYAGSFVGHWAHELLFFQAPEWVFTVIYCIFGAVVLGTWFFVPPNWPHGRRGKTK